MKTTITNTFVFDDPEAPMRLAATVSRQEPQPMPLMKYIGTMFLLAFSEP